MIFLAICLSAVIIFIAMVNKPIIGLCLTIGLIPYTENLPKIPLLGTTVSLLGFLTFGCYLFHFFIRLKPYRSIPATTIFWGTCFISACFLSIIVARVPVGFSLTTYLQLFLLFFLVTQLVRAQKDAHWLMASWVASIAIVQILGFLHFDITQISRANRFSGATNNANLIAYYCNISAWFVVYFIFKARRFPLRALLLGLLFLDFFVVLISFSRTGLIVLGVSALFAVFLLWKHLTRRMGWVCIAGIAAMILMSQFNFSALSQDISQIPGMVTGAKIRGNTFSDRTRLWGLWLQEWAETPLFGIGIGGTLSGEVLMINVPHNSFISVLVETGIIGIIFFLGMILQAYKSLFRLAKASKDQLGLSLPQVWLLVLIVWGLTSIANSQHYDKLLYLMIGMSVALRHIPSGSSDRPSSSGRICAGSQDSQGATR